jgi:hypothetical protein
VIHPLVEQLRFARTEWQRALRGVPEDDAMRRLEPMNSIGWICGHLAWQEQAYWLTRAQGTTPLPTLNETVASGMPATTPSLKEMRAAWRKVTRMADPWLDQLTTVDMTRELPRPPGYRRTIGDGLRRMTYHYWFHIGEILAIRQILGHKRLPEYVGNLEALAGYRPEPSA